MILDEGTTENNNDDNYNNCGYRNYLSGIYYK